MIEDKRFAEHNGVDWQGTLTGLSGYLSGDLDTRGGSTIEQQYVKNYQLLVTAQSDAERRAAVEITPARKLREMRMALTLDKTFTKAQILTRYLNLLSFGNNAFGVQDAARTYFGIDSKTNRTEQGNTSYRCRYRSRSGQRPVYRRRCCRTTTGSGSGSGSPPW